MHYTVRPFQSQHECYVMLCYVMLEMPLSGPPAHLAAAAWLGTTAGARRQAAWRRPRPGTSRSQAAGSCSCCCRLRRPGPWWAWWARRMGMGSTSQGVRSRPCNGAVPYEHSGGGSGPRPRRAARPPTANAVLSGLPEQRGRRQADAACVHACMHTTPCSAPHRLGGVRQQRQGLGQRAAVVGPASTPM